MQLPEIILSQDGSHTFYSPHYNSSYHSKYGAITESKHVFIEAGLKYLIKLKELETIRILELGFGTGLNAILSFEQTAGVNIIYHAIEKHPLSSDIIGRLNYPKELGFDIDILQRMHDLEWNEEHIINNSFSLKKLNSDWLSYVGDGTYDLIFLDFFGPDIQADLWNLASLSKMHSFLNVDGIITTFCAKGEFKRNLLSLGFKLDSLPGPPGKREMVRAIKLN